MSRRLRGTLAFVLCLFATPALAKGGTITVRAATLKPIKGQMLCRLYARPDGFPGGKGFQAEQWVTVTAATASCVFSDVVPGVYAISLFHDSNSNRHLDQNFIGIPKEGVGVSNNRFRIMAAPRFEDAKFQLKGDATIDIKLRYY
jgi:uncharacterized protein (DUF2141 family)